MLYLPREKNEINKNRPDFDHLIIPDRYDVNNVVACKLNILFVPHLIEDFKE